MVVKEPIHLYTSSEQYNEMIIVIILYHLSFRSVLRIPGKSLSSSSLAYKITNPSTQHPWTQREFVSLPEGRDRFLCISLFFDGAPQKAGSHTHEIRKMAKRCRKLWYFSTCTVKGLWELNFSYQNLTDTESGSK